MQKLKKILFLGLTTLWVGQAFAVDTGTPEAPAAKILFVCEHGNVKSLMAASYFNRIVQEKHLPYLAVSRGVEPDSATVPLGIVAGLRTDGFDVSGFHPSKLSAGDFDTAWRVITIGVPLSVTSNVRTSAAIAWDDVPPASVNFTASSASLKAHIDELIKQLETPEK